MNRGEGKGERGEGKGERLEVKLIEIRGDWEMKKVAASVLSLVAIGTWWSIERPIHKSVAASTADREQQSTIPDPFENEDSSTFAATPSTLARTANAQTTTPDSKLVTTAPKSAKRLKIQVEVTSPKDLKVKEGQHIAINDTVADNQHIQRTALNTELTSINLRLEKLKLAPKVTPIPPAKVNALKQTVKHSHAQEEAEIATVKGRIAQLQRKYQLVQSSTTLPLPETAKVRSLAQAAIDIETAIRTQQRKIDALKTIGDDDKFIGEIDKPITEHEDIQLAKLQQSLTEARLKVNEARSIEDTARTTRSNKVEEVRVEIATARRDLDLAHAKLTAAIEKSNQALADRQIAAAERDDRVFRTELERIKLTEVANLQKHDREYEIAQLQIKKTQLIAQIRELKGVTAPFNGTVKRVKLLAQQGNILRYEVGLMYATATVQPRADSIPQWEIDR